jgi:glycine/D-amino acid oxidase-like deaminating enzyme
MRIAIIGGGLAGSLLAWRLAADPRVRVALATGPRVTRDATSVSGGAVRGYESHPVQRALAIESLVELIGSKILRAWAGYRPGRSLIVESAPPADLGDAVDDVNRQLPRSAAVCDTTALERLGWADLGPDTVAVLEERAGRILPGALRDSVLADLARRRNVTVALQLAGGYDVLVYAAGAWTPGLLARAGYSAAGYRTKAIRYTVFRCGDWRPPVFSDGRLYGMPLDGGRLLLGQATDDWDVAPDVPAFVSTVDFAALTRRRLPRLRLGPVVRRAGAADCYTEPAVLALRSVAGNVFVFSGGSGGSAKTALAASARAAAELLGARTLATTSPT